jgi:hypothetical protein
VGATCASALTWTVGTPPAITLESPLPGEVVNEGEALTFAALVSDREDVAGDLTVRWESDRDGVFHEGAPDGTGLAQRVSSALSVGEHVLTVTVTDSAGLTATALGTFAVNGIPSAPGVSLSPGAPTTTDDLVVRIDAASVDPEGDALSYGYRWLRDGVASGASTSATLPASATADGETWTIEVWASDGLAESPVGSASVSIANTAPTLGSVAITPDPARRTDTLTCTPAGAADADGDSIAYTHRWTVDGVAAGSGATLTGPFAVGALIACTVTPTDGKDAGTDVSDSTTIVNTTPVVSSVTLSPGSVYTNDTLTASVVTSDADGDTVGVSYRWLVDGVEVAGATGASLSGAMSGSFDRDQVVTVEVTPNDGAEDGAAMTSAGVTVLNTAPTAPGIAITPESPEAGDDLTCSVVTPSTDADGDAVTYAFAWDVDGSTYAGATDAGTESVVAGADVGGGETWTCEVVAGDGGRTVSTRLAVPTREVLCTGLSFDGVNDYATFSSFQLLDQDFTIEAWIMPSDGYRGAIMSWGNSAPYMTFAKNHPSSCGNQLTMDEAGYANINGVDSCVPSSGWHHVAVTHRAGSGFTTSAFGFFVDGVPATRFSSGGPALTFPTQSAGNVGRDMGRYGTYFQYFGGTMDAVRVSSSIRYVAAFAPPAELTAEADSMLFWGMDEGTGSTVAGVGTSATPLMLFGPSWVTLDCAH